jgi:hypothetical protein
VCGLTFKFEGTGPGESHWQSHRTHSASDDSESDEPGNLFQSEKLESLYPSPGPPGNVRRRASHGGSAAVRVSRGLHNSGLYSIGKIICRDFSEPARADSDRRRHAGRNNHDDALRTSGSASG